MHKLIATAVVLVVLVGCNKVKPGEANLIIKIKFDNTLPRLDNFGQPATIPAGHAAQSPVAQSMSAHYIELAPNAYTQLEEGEVIYVGEETTQGGAKAVDWSKATIVSNDEVFLTIPFNQITPGTYEWVRVSLTYQNGDIAFTESGYDLTGRLASFVGYNTYITSHTVNSQTVDVNQNKLQGYWAFETVGQVFQGDAAVTTVPNPLDDTSPIPPGSCVVTGEFPTPFEVTGKEKEDVTMYLNFSTNNSFEWYEAVVDGKYEPSAGDSVVDMGLRGLWPTIE